MRFTSRTVRLPASSTYSTANLSRRMTAQVAAALIAFTLMQLWAMSTAIEMGAPRWLPLVGLVVLALGAIPTARLMERRWFRFGSGVLPCPKVAAQYRREIILMWSGVLFAPWIWVLLFGMLARGPA